MALTHVSGVRSHLWMSVLASQLGPRFRVLGTKALYVKFGLDIQETPCAPASDLMVPPGALSRKRNGGIWAPATTCGRSQPSRGTTAVSSGRGAGPSERHGDASRSARLVAGPRGHRGGAPIGDRAYGHQPVRPRAGRRRHLQEREPGRTQPPSRETPPADRRPYRMPVPSTLLRVTPSSEAMVGATSTLRT